MGFGGEYFREYYTDYFRQNPPYKLKHYHNLLSKYVKDGRLLDIGCSFGLFVEKAGEDFRCYGMDVDFGVVFEAAQRVPNATFVVGALPDIPFKAIDAITLLDVIEHVHDPESTMGALRKSLKPGGIALLVLPVYDGPLGWMVEVMDKDPTHIQKHSRQFWLDLAGRYFEVLEWEGAFRKLFFGQIYLNIPTRLLRKISPAIVMILKNREA